MGGRSAVDRIGLEYEASFVTQEWMFLASHGYKTSLIVALTY